ncbi:MAG TPA: hypothetical protein VFH27_00985 [Longimicrobiaceae bacterium]|nr:hypothetical protein [Longimicrobiaceae bacterium]
MDPTFIGLIAVVLGGLTVLTPVVAFSARFALRPIVDSMLRLKEAQASDRTDSLQDRRIAVLEAEIQSLQHSVRALQEGEEFRRELATPKPTALPAPQLVSSD